MPLCCCFTAVNSDETVNVTYVDFGNSEKLPFSEIRKLPDMFLRLPKQVIKLRCLISGMPHVRYGLICTQSSLDVEVKQIATPMQPFLSRQATLLRQKGEEHCVTRQKMLRGRLPYEPHVVMLLFLMFCVGNILRKFWDYYRNLATANERIVSVSTTVPAIVQTNTTPIPVSHSEQKNAFS